MAKKPKQLQSNRKEAPKPEKEVLVKGVIPLAYIELRVKELEKERQKVIIERQKLINETNRKVIELDQKIQRYNGAIEEVKGLKNMKGEESKVGNAK